MNARALLLCLPVALTVAACSAAPPDSNEDPSQDETTGSTSEALNNAPIQPHPGGIGVIDPGPIGPVNPGPYGAVPPFPFKRPTYCPKVDSECSMHSTTSWDDPASIAFNNELASYGCAPAQQWFSGYAAGWLGGLIAYCTDSLALRMHYSHWNFDVMDGACDKCIPKAQPGKVWILLEAFVGPNCQGGCKVRNEGGW